MMGLSVMLFSGCTPESHAPRGDDDFETPSFKKAKEKYEIRDFKGAIELYEDVLRENPRMAKAHFELGLIYDEKIGDFISAIYHYKRFLKLKPTGDNAKTVEQWIARAELQFATTQPNSPIDSANEIARLSKENLKIKSDLDEMHRVTAKYERQLGQLEKNFQESQARLQAAIAAQQAAAENSAASATQQRPTTPGDFTSTASSPSVPPVTRPFDGLPDSAPANQQAALPDGARQHIVKSGDTVWKIAAQYYPGNIKEGVDKIVAANKDSMPNPAKLKLGQPLIIP